jgi:hypothetical protein
LERAAAAGVEGGHVADGLAHRIAGQKRRHGVFERRQIVDVIVDRFERARCRIAHDVVHAPFGLAHKQRHAHIERLLQIRRKALEHREHAGDVEAADHDGDAGVAQRLGDMKRARILVRLHADQPDETEIAVGPHVSDDVVRADPRVGLVDRHDVDVDVRAENLALRAIVDQAVDGRQRIGRHRGAIPADHIAVVVVMRRLDQHDQETLVRGRSGMLVNRQRHPLPRLCCTRSSSSGNGTGRPANAHGGQNLRAWQRSAQILCPLWTLGSGRLGATRPPDATWNSIKR